jgi:hypothetical protein
MAFSGIALPFAGEAGIQGEPLFFQSENQIFLQN